MFVAGPYTAFWGQDIGKSKDGFHVRFTYHKEEIHTDDFGDALVDAVQRGVDVRVELEFAEYDLIKAAILAQSGGAAAISKNTKVGHLISTVALPLVLTKIGLTNAPEATWTFAKTVIDGDIDVLLASRLRGGPVTFLCLPTTSTNGLVVTTA